MRIHLAAALSATLASNAGCAPPPPEEFHTGMPGDILTPGNLLAIDGASSTDIWARTQRDLYHYDGSQWTLQSLPAGHGLLEDLRVVAANDVWLLTSTPAVLHWDGGTWTTTPVDCAPTGGCGTVGGMAVGDPNHVWVVGFGGVGAFLRLLRWDGSTWHAEQVPPGADNNSVLLLEHRAGFWFYKSDTLSHLTVDGWQITPWPDPSAGFNDSSLFAVRDEVYFVARRGVLRWDGTQFVSTAIPAPPVGDAVNESRLELSGTGANDLWMLDGVNYQCGGAVGALGSPGSTCPGRRLYHWDGMSWSARYDSHDNWVGGRNTGDTLQTEWGPMTWADDGSLWAIGMSGGEPSASLYRFRL